MLPAWLGLFAVADSSGGFNITLYGKSSARGGGRKNFKPGMQHSKTPHRTCFALETTARPCSAATGRSKSLLGRAAKPLGARNHRSSTHFRVRQHLENAAPAMLFRTFRSNLRLGRARQPLGAQNRCSGVLRSNVALGTAARASVAGFDNTFVFLAESLSKSLCFEFGIASSCALCDFAGTVKCHMRI